MPRFPAHTLVMLLVATAIALALGGCSGRASGASGVSPTDGKALVSVLCTRCHPVNRIQSAHKTRVAWTATVTRMQSHGLQVTGQQRASIIDYLTKRDGGK